MKLHKLKKTSGSVQTALELSEQCLTQSHSFGLLLGLPRSRLSTFLSPQELEVQAPRKSVCLWKGTCQMGSNPGGHGTVS